MVGRPPTRTNIHRNGGAEACRDGGADDGSIVLAVGRRWRIRGIRADWAQGGAAVLGPDSGGEASVEDGAMGGCGDRGRGAGTTKGRVSAERGPNLQVSAEEMRAGAVEEMRMGEGVGGDSRKKQMRED